MAVVMARKRKTAKERLRQEIERARNLRQLRHLIAGINPDFTDETVRAAYAHAVLSLDSEPVRSPLRKAFQEFGLNPIDPLDWRRLLASLSAIVFDRTASRPRGARPKWDEPRRMLFDTDVAEGPQANERACEQAWRHTANR